ncbi:tRNA pseudouridine(38-40) synthase TruA [Buchnera aphidicola]|uniref:tRNA pseudouridine synthase A n=1 Tax=Buchnera aphidicola (Sarucallis kahawaluokalani) TaxID=1241878 RepID=A0A4D6YCR3_9GAMM|nr:tRNA pseudouridine(38-40) synthase TruA [Buchnera aphidicola]QCI25943.1 tRNA pseudouridine(38-40) synthase TruA [Buchnera aphidicola (Sarucallis kahawaluokalani)]
MISELRIIKFAAGLEYDGSSYHGWQNQKLGISSIQGAVEKAISMVANHTVHVVCSGRTDAKVHSLGQVIHFTTFSIRKNISWLLGINNYLPKNISITWIKKVSKIFHARYSAVSRCYRYIIYNSITRSAIFDHRVGYVAGILNTKVMFQASQCIIGEHDFSSFRSIKCQSSTPFRKIIYINVFQVNQFIFIDIEANAFLQYMVRNIIGCLIEIGKMKKHFTWIIDVLNKKNRLFCGPTAHPSGLYLFTVKYPNFFQLPINNF